MTLYFNHENVGNPIVIFSIELLSNTFLAVTDVACMMYFQVKRQHEGMLINAVHELASGKVSAVTVAFLTSLSRPLHCDPDAVVRLCSLNAEVDLHNACMMEKMTGKEHRYIADDQGEDRYLLKMQVQKVGMNICHGCSIYYTTHA